MDCKQNSIGILFLRPSEKCDRVERRDPLPYTDRRRIDIETGSVVTKKVKPVEIVDGNPARVFPVIRKK